MCAKKFICGMLYYLKPVVASAYLEQEIQGPALMQHDSALGDSVSNMQLAALLDFIVVSCSQMEQEQVASHCWNGMYILPLSFHYFLVQ